MITKRHLEGEWFHGDERRTDFINRNYFDVIDYSRDRNAMGPGIYFTNLKYQASGYAGDSGYVYTVTVNLDPKRTLEDNTKPNRNVLRKFIERCPDREMLYNYSEDLSKAPEKAVEMNMDSANMLEAIMGLYNDLYQRDAVLFAKVMTEIGYDAFYHKVNPKYEPDAVHLIVYNPSIIKIVKEEHKGVKESIRLKHVKFYNQFLLESDQLPPHRYQDKGYTCGPTAVKMVLDWISYPDVSVDYLERISKTDSIVGCTDQSMALMLSTLGVKNQRYVGNKIASFDALRHAVDTGRKVIVRTLTKGIKHWIVVYGKAGNKFKIADPWLGLIEYTEAGLEAVWSPRDWDCFVVLSDPFPKLEVIDWNASVELAERCFPNEKSWLAGYLDDTTDKKLSVSLKVGSEVVGAYFLSEHSYPGEIGKGLEGVCLCVEDKYRGNGWGKMLISYAENLGFDYMWGQHMKHLNNINMWSKRREKIIDGGEVWISITRLK